MIKERDLDNLKLVFEDLTKINEGDWRERFGEQGWGEVIKQLVNRSDEIEGELARVHQQGIAARGGLHSLTNAIRGARGAATSDGKAWESGGRGNEGHGEKAMPGRRTRTKSDRGPREPVGSRVALRGGRLVLRGRGSALGRRSSESGVDVQRWRSLSWYSGGRRTPDQYR